MKVAIVGASGFIGCQLVKKFSGTYECIAISRTRPNIQEPFQWESCDLHNLKDLEKSLSGCDFAIYLVHSMLASSGLNQGRFQDFDISLADNFARAANACGISRVIYVSGLMPNSVLSAHLESRLEVEQLLGHYFPKLTILRAGIIIGDQSSSFSMMYRLATKLPLMICPSWTKTLSQPVFIEDVVSSIQYCLATDETQGTTFDIGCTDPISYQDMLREIGKKAGCQPIIFSIDIMSPKLSSYWLTLISGAPLELTRPLVGSLKEPMLVRPDHALPVPKSYQSFTEALDQTISSPSLVDFKPPHAFTSWFYKQKQKHVRSIQRLQLPSGWSAEDVAREYARWLPKLLKRLVRTDVSGIIISIRIPLLRMELLRLKYSASRSTSSRCLLYIVGGILVGKDNKKGRLEFRILPHRPEVLVAIHDFIPSLPWPIYRSTQAIIHDRVMNYFGRHLVEYSAH